MSKSPLFNYIITIHNKEDLIEQVIMSVLMCCRDNSHVYPVIDGCTDKTEEIIDRIITTYSGVPITKVYTPDVHELLSINAGLKTANQHEDGFNIVLQDDVILADFMLEQKVVALYEWVGPELGYVSFRLGANFKKDAATSDSSLPLTDYVENAYGHGLEEANVLLPGHFAFRTVPIKSPVCIPSSLVRLVGLYNECLAPYDDTEYAIRFQKAGYRNGVFAIKFISEIEWGGTRTTHQPELSNVLARNMKIIRELHMQNIIDICQLPQASDIVLVPNIASEAEVELGLKAWNCNRDKLAAYQCAIDSIMSKIKNKIIKSLK